MSLTYGGSPLLADNNADEIQKRLLDPYLPIVDFTGAEPFVDNLVPRTGWREERGVSYPRNQPHCHDKLNVLYWPTGAARWARFNALVAGDDLATICSKCQNGATPLPLVLTDDLNKASITAQMYLLPPRRLGNPSNVSASTLYLVPLVDYRYFNQFKNTGAMSTPTDWGSLFSSLSSQLSLMKWTAPSTDYTTIPDVSEIQRRYANPAEIMDAAAASIGQRAIYLTDGSASLQTFTAAQAAFDKNTTGATSIAGAAMTAQASAAVAGYAGIPAKVTVTFPWWYYGAPDPNGDVYALGQSLADASIPTVPGTSKSIHVTAFADRSSNNTETTPDNSSDCSALAVLIARDYYARTQRQADVTFQGIVNWTPNAYDDWIEWHFASRSCGQYECHTRVKSLDYNWGPEEMFHQFSGKNVYPSPSRYVLTENDGGGVGNAFTAAVFLSNIMAPTTDILRVYNPLGIFTGGVGSTSGGSTSGYATFMADTLRWEQLQRQC